MPPVAFPMAFVPVSKRSSSGSRIHSISSSSFNIIPALCLVNKILNSNMGIELFFVFNGLPWKKERPFSVEDRRPLIRNQAWDSYAAGKSDLAMSQWSIAGSVALNDLIPIALQILDEFDIPYVRAPYSSLGQLSYLDQQRLGYFHAVFAGSEFLLFPTTEMCITQIDFQKSSFIFMDKRMILQQLMCSADQFMVSTYLTFIVLTCSIIYLNMFRIWVCWRGLIISPHFLHFWMAAQEVFHFNVRCFIPL